MKVSESCGVFKTYALPFGIGICYFYTESEYYKLFLYRVFKDGVAEACSRYGIAAGGLPEFKFDLLRNRCIVQHGDGAAFEFVHQMCNNASLLKHVSSFRSKHLERFCSEYGTRICDGRYCIVPVEKLGDTEAAKSGYSVVSGVVICADIDLCEEKCDMIGCSGMFDRIYVSRCLPSGYGQNTDLQQLAKKVLEQAGCSGISSVEGILQKTDAFGSDGSDLAEAINAVLISNIDIGTDQTLDGILRKVV